MKNPVSINSSADSHITLNDLLESMSEVVGNENAKRTFATKLLARFTMGDRPSGSILYISPGGCGCGSMLTAMATRLGIVHTTPSVSRVLAMGSQGLKWEVLLQDIADSAWEEGGAEPVGIVHLRDVGNLLATTTGYSSSLMQSGLADLMRGRNITLTSPEQGMRRLDTRRIVFVVMVKSETTRVGHTIGFHSSSVRANFSFDVLSRAGFSSDLLGVFGYPVIEFQRLTSDQVVEVAARMAIRIAETYEPHHMRIRFDAVAIARAAMIGVKDGLTAMERWFSAACETLLPLMTHGGRRVEATVPHDILDGGAPAISFHEKVIRDRKIPKKITKPPTENIIIRPTRSKHHPGPRMAKRDDLVGLLNEVDREELP